MRKNGFSLCWITDHGTLFVNGGGWEQLAVVVDAEERFGSGNKKARDQAAGYNSSDKIRAVSSLHVYSTIF